MVSDGGNAPAMAIIEHVSHSQCRMRSMNVFDVGDQLEFPLAVHGSPTIALSGTVVSRKQIGPRYAYVISLKATSTQGEAIVKAAESVDVRSAPHTPDVHTGTGLTRTGVRIPVDIEVRYTQAGSPARVARATNISTGGVLMRTTDELPVGASLELEIPFGAELVTAHGRIVAHPHMTPNYNIAFYHMTNEARDIIARFIDSHSG
jgi:hypothetical protein